MSLMPPQGAGRCLDPGFHCWPIDTRDVEIRHRRLHDDLPQLLHTRLPMGSQPCQGSGLRKVPACLRHSSSTTRKQDYQRAKVSTTRTSRHKSIAPVSCSTTLSTNFFPILHHGRVYPPRPVILCVWIRCRRPGWHAPPQAFCRAGIHASLSYKQFLSARGDIRRKSLRASDLEVDLIATRLPIHLVNNPRNSSFLPPSSLIVTVFEPRHDRFSDCGPHLASVGADHPGHRRGEPRQYQWRSRPLRIK
ncbi:hypothetical protein BDY17DRAFT_179276 [Neohortaea acidophila]|uniref:Uncharacterized protein n=1 Tax=Neohortaea acidophila TaxID=245834 RepID=A0A6A6PQW2_9PEZI|nr:uncharacterized protein BDY17DRAFT_179276 [Neohortaea acidophila]KAF2482186.1 hypothetical protein BDY17DRAFT_179276 [Neohortaea acidophila]